MEISHTKCITVNVTLTGHPSNGMVCTDNSVTENISHSSSLRIIPQLLIIMCCWLV